MFAKLKKVSGSFGFICKALWFAAKDFVIFPVFLKITPSAFHPKKKFGKFLVIFIAIFSGAS